MSFIFLVSGPSGSGKSSLLSKLLSEFKQEVYFSISSTTRQSRSNEKDGIDYNFISLDEFKAKIKQNQFLEYAQVHNNFYGTLLDPINNALNNGKIAILDIDTQGYIQAKEKLKEKIISVFISTKDKFELKTRLIKRNSDNETQINKRLENASYEMKEIFRYDYLVINDELEKSYENLRAIFLASKFCVKNQNINEIQTNWNKGD